MDVNGTRFHLFLGRTDWLRRTDIGARIATTAEGVAWSDERSEITLRPVPFVFPAAPRDRAPAIDDRRGAARDRFGNWYWIDTSATEILVRSVGSRVTSRFWRTGDGASCAGERRDEAFAQLSETAAGAPPLQLGGLAVTDDHYLVAGVVDPPGLLVFVGTPATPRCRTACRSPLRHGAAI